MRQNDRIHRIRRHPGNGGQLALGRRDKHLRVDHDETRVADDEACVADPTRNPVDSAPERLNR